MLKCVHCSKDFAARHLRPYALGGELTCHPCAMATPERKAIAESAIAKVLSQPGPVTLTPTGIRPSSQAEIDRAVETVMAKIRGSKPETLQ